MSEVSVNIRGRDDGLSSQLNNLRQQAKDLGRDLSELEGYSSMTQTQKKVATSRLSESTLRDSSNTIREEYNAIRRSNYDEFSETKSKYEAGEISDAQFAKYKKEFEVNTDSLGKQEDEELLNLEREMNQHLRAIHKEISDQSKIEREEKQRDREEFRDSGGVQGQLLNENRKLRKQQFLADDEDEVAAIQRRIDQNNEKLNSLKRPDSNKDGAWSDFGQAAGAAGTGDMMGAVGGGMRGMGKMIGGAAKAFSIAGLATIILKETLGFGDKLREAVAPIASMRGGNRTGNDFSNQMRSFGGDFSKDSRFDFGQYGLDNVEFAEKMNQRARGSAMAGNDLAGRTYRSVGFEKGFGADTGLFDQFERFTKGQEDSTEIALDVLNVLTSIDKSSLKETDLSALTEKLQSQQTILAFQRQKRDVVDNDSSLRVLSAFESLGMSIKGEKGGSFLNQTLQGLGEGGSDNLMMLKLEAARKSRPDLANNPAALRRLVRFNPDDPEYMSELFKMGGQMTGGNELAEDDFITSFFNPESGADMEIYRKALRGGNFQEMLKGKNLESLKQRKGTLDEATMERDATSGVGQITESIKDFSNRSQSMVDTISSALKSLVFGTDALNVRMLEDKTKKGGSRVNNKNIIHSGE